MWPSIGQPFKVRVTPAMFDEIKKWTFLHENGQISTESLIENAREMGLPIEEMLYNETEVVVKPDYYSFREVLINKCLHMN